LRINLNNWGRSTPDQKTVALSTHNMQS
jgi:hypothetical protein